MNIIKDSDDNDHETGRETAAVSTEQVAKDVNKYLCELVQLGITKKVNTKVSTYDYEEPKSYEEAWYHNDPKQRVKWHAAITKEFGDMAKRVVWTVIERKAMPVGHRCVKCKWVFKIKRSGVFIARFVACGYSQIPGVDFTENYSPVVNDVTFRLLLLIWIYFKLTAKIVDVETAFYMVN